MNQTTMLEGHLAATIQRAKATQGEYLLAIQDTTYYNYTTHKAMQGLGIIQGHIKGIMQHNVLLTSQLGMPLGIVNQQHWSREGEVNFEGKESLKWERGLKSVNTNLAQVGKQVVVVQDREADILDFFNAPRVSNVDLLVRVHQPRYVSVVDSGQVLALPDLSAALPLMGRQRVTIERDGKRIDLELALQAGQVQVLAGKHAAAHGEDSVALSVVIAREVGAFDAKGVCVFDADKAAIWFLLSSLPIATQDDIERITGFYSLRWRIERFHYTLKSGALNVEKRQFDDLQTMINGLVFYSIVGWHLVALTYLVRQCADADASCCFDATELGVLEKVSNQPLGTVRDAILCLSKLVGFAPSTRQPLPGIRVLSQALERLYYLKMGFQLNNS